MAYDVNEYTNNQGTKITIESDNGLPHLTNNKYISFLWAGIKRALQWSAWKWIFGAAFLLIMLWMGVSKKDASQAADTMSTHAASDGWLAAFDEFKSNTDFKSTKANSHPLYNSEIIKAWEQETKLKFNDLYQYIVIKDTDGIKEDLLVMKKPAFDPEDSEKKVLNLEYSTMVTDDAEDICDKYFGDIPTDYQKSFYDRKRHWNIKKIKKEITQENDDEGQFRCVINHETIYDLIND